MLEKLLEFESRNLFMVIIAAFAIVLFWRGTWGILDVFLFPGNLVWSYSISIIIGIFILFLIRKPLASKK